MDQWVEMLGCGIMHPDIMKACGRGDKIAWALGMGLERYAMKLFDIPDIRLFWSQDQRVTSQFKAGEISKFKPFSKYPSCFKDISFWVQKISANLKKTMFMSWPEELVEISLKELIAWILLKIRKRTEPANAIVLIIVALKGLCKMKK